MREHLQFYIDGAWVNPVELRTLDVINPATEAPAGRIAMGGEEDVNRAVAAARRAFASYSRTTRADRLDLFSSIIEAYKARAADIAEAVRLEMGAPKKLAETAQTALGLLHLQTARKVLESYEFETQRGKTLIRHEPIGVCGFITPWNWPLNQLACKIAPALATGCTMVLKPSEMSPLSAIIWAEVMHTAGVPAGVFNLVNGDGAGVGAALSLHPDVDMMSFTGSTRAGIEVARNAAYTVKRVAQELGGKSPNIILPDADFAKAVTAGTRQMFSNTGQSCNAPSRMLVPIERMDEAAAIARAVAEKVVVGDPAGDADMGPVISERQWNRIQSLIGAGLAEGATLVTGGQGRPEGLNRGWFVRPTVFSHVTNDMTIAREEIFGPVLSILGYKDVDQAVEIGNDTVYGLAAYVQGSDHTTIRSVMERLRAGQVIVNGGAGGDMMAPFGGYKQSGNGREWGDFAFAEFLEVKAAINFTA